MPLIVVVKYKRHHLNSFYHPRSLEFKKPFPHKTKPTFFQIQTTYVVVHLTPNLLKAGMDEMSRPHSKAVGLEHQLMVQNASAPAKLK